MRIIGLLNYRRSGLGEVLGLTAFVFVVLFFLLDALQRQITSAKFAPNPSETVNYWWLVTIRSGVFPYVALLIATICAFLAFAALIRGYAANRWRTCGIVIAALICLMLTCWLSFALGMGANLTYPTHVETIHFGEHVYHLTEVSYQSAGASYFTNAVYECDASSINCQPILNDLFPDPTVSRIQHFVVDTDKNQLYVEIENRRFLVR